MSSEKRFGLLRNLLRALGLSQVAVDDIVDWIAELLAGKGEGDAEAEQLPEFPYRQRDPFLSPAELSFFSVLRGLAGRNAVVCPKVGLGDLFQTSLDNPSKFRIYTNKIDRKHVDFLLCDPDTIRPLLGIELDDKSHQREDRRARDHFVDQVFAAAGLPLLHIPARREYAVAELHSQVTPYIARPAAPAYFAPPPREPVQPIPLRTLNSEMLEVPVATPIPSPSARDTAPACPKCGREMVLRSAKSGPNAGNRFWGCSGYPACRGIVPFTEQA